jgi:hypothetical protein
MCMTDVTHKDISWLYNSEKQNHPLCFLICYKKTVDAAYANGRQALPSDSCCSEGEKIWKLICVEIWLDRVVGALKRLQGSHTCKRAELNAYADVKPAVPVPELELRNWWNLREQAESCSLRFDQTGYQYPTGHPPCISGMLWFGTCHVGEEM